ncbi:MAG: DUF3134 family protein [Coleofasciculaceae cyanobacterium SM2_3_26]|nr:DUF3134 family protein [Coleofasciculaceae cyanobacterium SM2_3_26]
MHNPSLREEPRHHKARVVPLEENSTLLDWLESTGRLIPRDVVEEAFSEEDEEISELMGGDDSSYDLDDDAGDMDIE